ncbi:mitochondrial tRNA-specific 2-thiouridylase 1 [Phlebotomus argentipes]|uniref:mitochondrial tRNA-specific 2-thiouridylase 1 n=1 Tax=Phlebotomus argentipes TaxID=94469 RepID=UPI002892EB5E|nr:mitochondrial tRNA-specific 2-thiouridylase 1 [Phlebotomus argentipes]
MRKIPFKNIVVGISGGVDSAVAALLLKNKGYRLQGVFMRNWDIVDEKTTCTGDQDWEDAQRVCNHLKIPLIYVNFVKEYWNNVFTQFLRDYESGLTPNPDILCNRFIKFDNFFAFATRADKLNADAIATGHYARNSFGNFLEHFCPESNVKLLQARDSMKDQTFFLSSVPQRALRRTMFPLGDFTKDQVKTMARDAGMGFLLRKKESTGICFIGHRNFQDFISEYISTKPGKLVDIDTGSVVGSHNGIHNWTVGQRCRLAGFPQPYFIAQKDCNSNIIFVAEGSKNPALYSKVFHTESPYWIAEDCLPRLGEGFECLFRFQHRKPLTKCQLERDSAAPGGLLVTLENPLRAITPGQYAVFYGETECYGCARITTTICGEEAPEQEYKVLC